MSREFKFRAWDKKAKKMISWNDLHHRDGLDIFQNPDLEVMQFTGLYDREGNEIYEDDIVESPDYYPSLVNFTDGTFWAGDTFLHDVDYDAPCEILGNLHKNPDLLPED